MFASNFSVKYTMIEADKMLHLQKCILTALRRGTKSYVARSLHSASPSAREEGYVLRSLHHYYSKVNSRPIHPAYSIRPFSTIVVQSSVDEVNQKLILFCNDVKHDQTCSVDRLKEVIQLCNVGNHQLQSSTSVQLLSCCGNLPSTVGFNEKQNLVDQVWQLVKRNDDTLTLEHYNTLLDVHAKNCSSMDPHEFLDNMSIQPDDNTYRLLFNTAIKGGNIQHLQSITKMILGKNIPLNEDSFRTPIQTLLAKDNITEALNIIILAQDAQLPVDKLYTELACKYATQGDISNLIKILNDEPQSDASLFKIIKSLSVSNNGRYIPDVASFISDTPDNFDINHLMMDLIQADRIVDACAVIDYVTMNKKNMQYMSFINSFLNQLIMSGAPTEIITKYATNFIKSGCELMALTNVADISLKLMREELSLAIFEVMHQNGIKIRAHYYWPLLMNAHKTKGEAKMYSLVESMQAKGVEFDTDTLNSYILPYVSTMNPVTTWQRFQAIGVPAYSLSTPFVLFLLSRQRLDDVFRLYEYTQHTLNYRMLLKSLMHVYLVTRDHERCARVLTRYRQGFMYVGLFLSNILRHDNLGFTMDDFESLLRTFNRHGVKFSLNDSNYLQSKINRNTSPEVSIKLCNIVRGMMSESLQFSMTMTIPHPLIMTSNELACHLVELKSTERSTRHVLMLLMKMCYLRNDLKAAEELKQEFDSQDYPWPFSMRMRLFYLYVTHNKLKEAKALLFETNRRFDSYLFDTDKILMFATALVKAGEAKVACNVIESCADFHTAYITSDSGKFLNALAESTDCNQTEGMLHFMVKNNYCRINTEVLEPLVAIALNRNISSAVNTLIKCARDYKKLPLIVEVMTALLREKGNQRVQNINKLIEEVYQMIANLNNVDEANTIVILGLANLNKMEELRTILQKQNISAKRLVHHFNNSQRDKDPNVLFKIFEENPNPDFIENCYFCNTLLSFYSKAGDCNSVLALWELIRAKNFNPDQAFRQVITEFLVMNKVPLPGDLEPEIDHVNISNQ